VPINLELKMQRFDDLITVPVQPAFLEMLSLAGTTQTERKKILEHRATFFE
jgi:hypothetical protein